MRCHCELNETNKAYLDRFCIILDDMIHGMTHRALTDSIADNFIMQMIPHHRAAIEMSVNILDYSNNMQIQNIASNIITEQTKSIEDMLNVQSVCSSIRNSPCHLEHYQNRFNAITATMFEEMYNACTDNNLNANFIREMIPHHQGAIEMSENVSQYIICPQLHPIIRSITLSQTRGIARMETLLACLTGR